MSKKQGKLQIFPKDNPWNQDVSEKPTRKRSDEYIASIGADESIHPDFGTIWEGEPNGIPYTMIDGNQKKVEIEFDYDDESDAGPYPIPKNAAQEASGDGHIILIDKDNHILYELFDASKSGNAWRAGSGAIWDLDSNKLRTKYWTSADAAGLPIFPGLVRYEEVKSGEIKHALRFTAENTQKAFISPARHFASDDTSSSVLPMGLRIRLKKDFDISGFSKTNQIILKALKKYGMFLADNGGNWFISGAPDKRWDDEELGELKEIEDSNFEAVNTGSIEH